jgi:catechol 2,3-dioxygenase-like lactoylglutathione lyase family enzyme
MALTVDHVPFACSDLEDTTATLDALGLEPEYGGVHDNGCTHMSVLGFDDGSYLELIAEHEQGDHDFWPAHIRADAGPAAWCIRVPDVATECVRVIQRGQPVQGPFYGTRERDDGTLVEWDYATFGTEQQRLLLPFAIADRTPRSYRVTPSPSVADSPLTGIGQVVLAVEDVDATVSLFRDWYGCARPERATVPAFGRVASIPGSPVALASPDETPWLTDRLAQFREGPCSCLFATDDLDAARASYPLADPRPWPDGRVAFFEDDTFGPQLGVVERA